MQSSLEKRYQLTYVNQCGGWKLPVWTNKMNIGPKQTFGMHDVKAASFYIQYYLLLLQ